MHSFLSVRAMGNAALCAGCRDSPSDAVTVLKADGEVLTFESSIRVRDLLLEFPHHFMCHSSSLLLLQQVKILPLGTALIPGEVYFLVPVPGQHHEEPDHHYDVDCDMDSLLHLQAPPKRTGSSMKFFVSPEQFSRIMSGSVLREGSSKLKRQLSRKLSRRASASWQPRLRSIGEVEACN